MNPHEKNEVQALLEALEDAERLLGFAGCPTSWMLNAKQRATALLDAKPQPQPSSFIAALASGNVMLDGVTVEGMGNGDIRIYPTRGSA